MKNPAAVSLGKLAKGVKKKISADERKARSERLSEARKKRWPNSGPTTSHHTS